MTRRHDSLIPLSREHHSALVMAMRIDREMPDADEVGVRDVYKTLMAFWEQGLLPHFRAEGECLLARLVCHVDAEDEKVRRTNRDHVCMAALVVRMRDTPDVETQRKLLLEFAGTIRTHIRWEEDVLFDETERLLTGAEIGALGADVAERVGDGNAWEGKVWDGSGNRFETEADAAEDQCRLPGGSFGGPQGGPGGKE